MRWAVHYETAYKVDIFIPKLRSFDQMQLTRRMASIVSTDPERIIYVTSPEDIILSKLEWYRMGNEVSDRQWRDILGVMKMKADQLDLEYLRKGAKDLGVEDLYERTCLERAINISYPGFIAGSTARKIRLLQIPAPLAP